MLNLILESIVKHGGTPIKVGGYVRDKFLGRPSKDIDVEVYGMSIDMLENLLSFFGRVSVVGKSFGVVKLTTPVGDEYDFSLPRRENKVGVGHRDFEVTTDSSLTPVEAALRRDFTMNALGEYIDGSILDPFGGVKDIETRVLRATSPHFAEDPLRVLRGFQFASRFCMTVEPVTAQLCASLKDEFYSLPSERIWMEWEKWAEKGVRPSMGLKFLQEVGWLELFPELYHLVGVPQDPEWHPEGCAWTHTMHVCDAAAAIADRENLSGENRIVLIMAALCHDLGKAMPQHGGTTAFIDGRWRAYAHDDAGVPLTISFLGRIGCLNRIQERVWPLVKEHMVHCGQGSPTEKTVRRLSTRMGEATIQELLWLIEADMNGRPPLAGDLPESAIKIGEIASQLNIAKNKPLPIVMGRHLITRGLKPGPSFKVILDKCFEAQLEGLFDESSFEQFLDSILS